MGTPERSQEQQLQLLDQQQQQQQHQQQNLEQQAEQTVGNGSDANKLPSISTAIAQPMQLKPIMMNRPHDGGINHLWSYVNLLESRIRAMEEKLTKTEARLQQIESSQPSTSA
jgi:hypothetical protein